MESLDVNEPVTVPDGGVWTPTVEQQLHDWHKGGAVGALRERRSVSKIQLLGGHPRRHFFQVVGTAIFAGLQKDSPRAPLVALASILAAMLAGPPDISSILRTRCTARYGWRLALGNSAGHRTDSAPSHGLPRHSKGLSRCRPEGIESCGAGRAGAQLQILEARSATLRSKTNAAYETEMLS